MLAALAASGQTPSAFARRVGIGPYRVSYWRARLSGDAAPRLASGGFVPVVIRNETPTADHQDSAHDLRVEVTLVNGRRVAFTGRWDVAAVAPWLRALEVA
jgi:hypothetical protein